MLHMCTNLWKARRPPRRAVQTELSLAAGTGRMYSSKGWHGDYKDGCRSGVEDRSGGVREGIPSGLRFASLESSKRIAEGRWAFRERGGSMRALRGRQLFCLFDSQLGVRLFGIDCYPTLK
jgi:hypothetical protein